jgi:hypothetical protein
MFRVLFAPILRNTTAAYSHRCVYGFGMLVHWSMYWLGHPHKFSLVLILPETCRTKNKVE